MPTTLYVLPVGQPSRAVTWFIAKNKIPDIEVKPIDLSKGENLTPEFTELSKGYQTVPILVVDGVTIAESGPILTYLSAKHGGVDYPTDPLQQALVQEAIVKHGGLSRNVTMCGIRPLLGIWANPKMTKAEQMAGVKAEAPVLKESVEFVDGILAKNKFIAGETFSIADYIVASELTQIQAMCDNGLMPEGCTLGSLPNISRYLEELSKMDGYEAFVGMFPVVLPMLIAKE